MILTYKVQGGDFSNAGKCSSEVKKVHLPALLKSQVNVVAK
ncbi:MAG TPA: hypothetical protein PK371_05310 [Bacteroidales bacterium]|nr:hypothetical protein [Bacteroidales bacterium]